MAVQTLMQPHQSAPAGALPGTWKLGAGRAITLQPREAGVFRVAHGQLWATSQGPHGLSPDDSGDMILGAGQQLRLMPGQQLVIEAWTAQAPAYFSWDPLPAPVLQPSLRMAGVVQPLADLRLALALGVGAAGRLVAGLAGFVLGLAADWARPSRADRALRAQSSAWRAHGAIS